MKNNNIINLNAKHLGKGAQHTAAEITELNGEPVPAKSFVAKFPRAFGKLYTWDDTTFASAKEDLDDLESIPSIKIIETEVRNDVHITLEDKKGNISELDPNYTYLQEYSTDPTLKEPELAIKHIADQANRILQESWQFYLEQGKAADLLGFETFSGIGKFMIDRETPLQISNFHTRKNEKTGEKDLILIDTRMLEPRRVNPLIRLYLLLLINMQYTAFSTILSRHNPELEKDLPKTHWLGRSVSKAMFFFIRLVLENREKQANKTAHINSKNEATVRVASSTDDET